MMSEEKLNEIEMAEKRNQGSDVDIGPMLNRTRIKLSEFYSKFNRDLVALTGMHQFKQWDQPL